VKLAELPSGIGRASAATGELALAALTMRPIVAVLGQGACRLQIRGDAALRSFAAKPTFQSNISDNA